MEEKKFGRIFIIFNGRFPGEQAHALFVAKSAEAFNKLGYKSIIIAPNRERVLMSPKEYFQLPFSPDVVYINAYDFTKAKRAKFLVYYLYNVTFSLRVKRYLKQNFKQGDIVYTNNTYTLPFLKGYPVCYELHDFPENLFSVYRFCLKFAKKILVTNKWKESELHKVFPETKSKTFVELNAVDLEKFSNLDAKEELRNGLGIANHERVVLYTGHLYGWKGAETLAEAAKTLPDINFYFLGGKSSDVVAFKKKYSSFNNIIVLGHQPHADIPLWQKSADVLVIPNTAKENISKYYTSPMKLFEYMASKVPVVASDLPSVREVTGDKSVYFAIPDNPVSFAEKIKFVLNSPNDFEKIELAYSIVSKHTWQSRAERIIQQLQKIV